MILFIGWVSIIVGALSLLVGLSFLVQTLWFLSGARRAVGKVVDHAVEWVTSHDENGTRTYQVYYPVVEFDDASGAKQRVRMAFGSTSAEHTVGCPVTVLYRPERPTSARLDSFWHLWFFALAVSLCGGLSILFGAAFKYSAETGDTGFDFAMIFTGFGGAFFVIGLAMFFHAFRSRWRTRRVYGVVLDIGTIEFQADDGSTHRLSASRCYGRAAGARVTVRYDRDNPGKARLASDMIPWMFPVMFTGLGGLVLALGMTFCIACFMNPA